MLLWHSFFFFFFLLLLSRIASTFAHSVKPDRCEFGRCARNCWRQTVSDSAWPVDVIKLRQNWFRRHKPVITCVCVHRRLKFSCHLKNRYDVISSRRVARGAIWQSDAVYNMPITVTWLFLSFLNSWLLLRRRNTTSGFVLVDVIVFK